MGMFKVDENRWDRVMHLINNFFAPKATATTEGQEVIIFVRAKNPENLFDENFKDKEIFMFNTSSKECGDSIYATLQERRMIENTINNPEFMHKAFLNTKYPTTAKGVFEGTKQRLLATDSCDFAKLNQFIVGNFYKLSNYDILRIGEFRERTLNFCVDKNIVSEKFAAKQKEKLPNSVIKITVHKETGREI